MYHGPFLGIGTLLLSAGIALLMERAWSRWLYLLCACLATGLLLRHIPSVAALYRHYSNPPEGAYIVLSREEFVSILVRYDAPALGFFAAAVLSTVLVFRHFRLARALTVPSSGLPPAAAHVKR